MVTPTRSYRDGFRSIRAGGLDWDSLPLRLFAKGNAKFWNPADIDLAADAEHWVLAAETGHERVGLLMMTILFIAGEEAVTQDIQPFIRAMAAEGRLADELFLTQFCFEEAKHTEAFRRWLDAIGETGDLHAHISDNLGYRTLMYEELPASLHALEADPSPANQVRASVTYNHIIEGVLALTGYYSWNRVCAESGGLFPGMRQIIKHIGDDERRHMAWGTYTCRRHVAADDRNWQVVRDRADELAPHALSVLTFGVDRLYPDGKPPLGPSRDELVAYATGRLNRRLGAIESARGAVVEGVDRDVSPEDLEEAFGRQDAAEFAEYAPGG